MFSNIEFAFHSLLSLFVLIISILINAFKTVFNCNNNVNSENVMKQDLRDKVVVVTGANVGIGRSVATHLAKYGATVILACRDIPKGLEASASINTELKQCCDKKFPFASFDFKDKLKTQFSRIDILINNAGINMKGILPNGLEQLFHVNYLGHYLLVRCLEDFLCNQCGDSLEAARIINLSSVTHHVGQPDFEKSALSKYTNVMKANCSYYADSKLYMNYLTMEINQRYDHCKPYRKILSKVGVDNIVATRRPIISISVNPGAVRSDIWRDYSFKSLLDIFMKLFFLEVEEGAATTIYAATVDINIIRQYQINAAEQSVGFKAINTAADAFTIPVALSSGAEVTAEELFNNKLNSSIYNGDNDVGGKMLYRPDLPYYTPYSTNFCGRPLLALEMMGLFAGAQLSATSLPEEGMVVLSPKQPPPQPSLQQASSSQSQQQQQQSHSVSVVYSQQKLAPSIQALNLWNYSAKLCKELLVSSGTNVEDLHFIDP